MAAYDASSLVWCWERFSHSIRAVVVCFLHRLNDLEISITMLGRHEEKYSVAN